LLCWLLVALCRLSIASSVAFLGGFVGSLVSCNSKTRSNPTYIIVVVLDSLVATQRVDLLALGYPKSRSTSISKQY
jgi:hypothetical protein